VEFRRRHRSARRDEEKSRAKERIFSFRDSRGQWDPKNQRPELWNLFNSRIEPGESLRIFPLSNWTELDIWQYIHAERIPSCTVLCQGTAHDGARGVVDLCRTAIIPMLPGEKPQMIKCRMRSLGCSPCTGAIRSDADTLPKIIEELISFRRSEREIASLTTTRKAPWNEETRGYF